jgi:hypothetical protein
MRHNMGSMVWVSHNGGPGVRLRKVKVEGADERP